MNELSKERLEELRGMFAASANKDIYSALCELLALRERAKPVAYMYRDNLHADARFSLETRFGNWSPEDIAEYEITETKLYAAPPAPVVADELLTAMEEVLRISDRQHDAWDKAKVAVSACRAAMLAAAPAPGKEG